MYERFTDRARKVMQVANEEALRYQHEYIGTEHVLLALIVESAGVAAHALKNLNVNLNEARHQVELIIQPGLDPIASGRLPSTPRVKKVIEYAWEEAHALQHNYVGTEHLLLGLLHEDECVAAQVLMNLERTSELVRQEVINLLGYGQEAAEPSAILSKSGEHLNLDTQRLPEHAQKIVAEFDCQIEAIKQERADVVGSQQWESATRLRDLQDKLISLRAEFIRQWPA